MLSNFRTFEYLFVYNSFEKEKKPKQKSLTEKFYREEMQNQENQSTNWTNMSSFEFKVDFEDNSSQELDEDELNNMVEGVKPESTKKCTAWGIKKLFKWAEKRNKNIDLKTISLVDLNDLLRKFYAEVKTEKKKMLTPSALGYELPFTARLHPHHTIVV